MIKELPSKHRESSVSSQLKFNFLSNLIMCTQIVHSCNDNLDNSKDKKLPHVINIYLRTKIIICLPFHFLGAVRPPPGGLVDLELSVQIQDCSSLYFTVSVRAYCFIYFAVKTFSIDTQWATFCKWKKIYIKVYETIDLTWYITRK